MQVSFLSTHYVIAALVQAVKVRQCFSERINQNHNRSCPEGMISSEFSKWVTMQFKYLGETTIRPASILGNIYGTFVSAYSVNQKRSYEIKKNSCTPDKVFVY